MTPGELLAEARDEEEAVVDREAEAEGRREVLGEHRHACERGKHTQHEERAHHGDTPADEGEQRSHDRAVHDEQEHERDGYGDELGGQEAALDQRVDLVEGRTEPADADPHRAGTWAKVAAICGSRWTIWFSSPAILATISA